MNSVPGSGDSYKAVGSLSQMRGSGWFSDRLNPGLHDQTIASRPSNPHPYLPEITRQLLLDTSESESENCEPATRKSGGGRIPEDSRFSDCPRISPHEPGRSRQSSVQSPGCESIRLHSNSPRSSSSKVIEPKNNLRFIPSPHPDMIHRIGSGSRSSKFESAAESSSSWKNPGPSQFLVPHQFDPVRSVKVAGLADSSGPFVPPSVPKSRFKTASSVMCSTEKLSSGSMDDNSKVNPNRDSGKQMVPHQWTGVPSGHVILDQDISGTFNDESGSRSNSSYAHVEPVKSTGLRFEVVHSHQNLGRQHGFLDGQSSSEAVSRFNKEIPRRDEFVYHGHRNLPSSAQPAPTANMNYVDVASSSHRKTTHRAVSIQSERVLGKCNKGFLGTQCTALGGDFGKGPPSFHSLQVPSLSNAVVAVSHQQTGSQQIFSHRPIKSEPTEFEGRSSMPQSLLSSQVPNCGQESVSFMHPLDSQLAKPSQTSHLQPEQVVSDPVLPGRSASETSVDPRNIPSSSQNLTSRLTSSSAGFGHSNSSNFGIDVGTTNDSSRSARYVDPSNQSYMDANSRTIDSPRDGGCQITSESSDSGIVVMSLVHKKNKTAGSSYNSSTGQVCLLESVTENFEFCTTVLALRSVSPSIVVVSSSGATRFVKELKAEIEGDQTLKDCQFQCISPRYFAYTFARRTVLESSLWEGCVTFRSEDAKKSTIVSNINLNDERLVCAFGGLLYYLSTSCPQLGAGLSPTPISSVQHMKLNHKLWLDTESFKNLQIFDPAEHPSSFKWSSSNRDDGKSIFGLFERFCSSVGLTKLKSFLANPVNCRRTLEKRHEVMNFYLNHSNYSAVEALRSFASQMSSSSIVMSYLSSPTLRGGHWKHIYRHIYYTVSFAEVCRSNGNQSELFRELGAKIVDAVYSMAHNLERVVDLVNMENNETFVIKYGFHPPLDAAKEKFSRLKMAMDKVTPHEFDSVPSFITRIQMMYIPEMKFLLSIPYWAPDLSKEELNLPNLEFKFTANKTAFYKSRRCYELDELLGDAQTDIINEESMIIQSLRNYLKKHMHHIVGMAQKIAEIECIFALAKVAREERYTKPEILDSCVIDVRGGWHPLLDVPSNEVITNDMVSSADTSLVKLIHGPNASGKSIYLKQVGLIMYLVHVGSYVPAVSARVGLFSRILARTTMEESVMSMSSTMLSELKKLQDAVMGGTKDSLVILDEVGKGSTEINCIAIVTSAVNYFLSQGTGCPHVLISTHISGISDFVTSPAHSFDGKNLFELLIMDYTITDGEIVFLYKIRRGGPDGSFVFEVLENSEFAAPIVKTTRTVLEALRTGENFLPYCEIRIQRSHKYLTFIRKFVNIDMSKQGYLEKLQNKIQRYYEKPSY